MKSVIASIVIAICAASAAHAAPITGTSTGLPVVPGVTAVTDFEGLAYGNFAAVTLNGITVSGIGGNLRSAGTYQGQFNMQGAVYIDNMSGATNGFRFGFAMPVSAFAFHFGASDYTWTLTAFNAAGAAIESLAVSPTRGSNSGNYYGIAGAGMAYATFTGSGDWVMVDNFAVAAEQVPEPGSITLLGLGLVAVAALRRRRKA